MYITTYQINKPKIVRFLKFKFPIIIKLNFNGGQFYKKILNFDYFKKLWILHKIKFEIKNGEHLCWKYCVENFDLKILSEFKFNRYIDKWFI